MIRYPSLRPKRFARVPLKRVLAAGVVAAAAVAAPTAALAHLLVSPLRAAITPDAETAEVEIRNQSERSIKVRASWIELRAEPDGGYTEPERAAPLRDMAASPFLTAAPTEQWLSAGEAFKVKLTVTDRDAWAGGQEKRSHLLIESLPARSALRRVSTFDVPLDLILGVSVPVLIKPDGKPAKAKIDAAAFTRQGDGDLALEATLRSKSRLSPYGAFEVFWRPEAGAAPLELAVIENVAVYQDAGGERRVLAPLGYGSFPGGFIDAKFVGRGEYDGVLFDERSFRIEPPPEDAPPLQ